MLKSRTYDGLCIETLEHSDRKGVHPETTAKMHRWQVRAHIYLNGINRLPEVADWKETDSNA